MWNLGLNSPRVCGIKYSWSRRSLAGKLVPWCLCSICPTRCSDKLSELCDSSFRESAPPLVATSLYPFPSVRSLGNFKVLRTHWSDHPEGELSLKYFCFCQGDCNLRESAERKFQATSVFLFPHQEIQELIEGLSFLRRHLPTGTGKMSGQSWTSVQVVRGLESRIDSSFVNYAMYCSFKQMLMKMSVSSYDWAGFIPLCQMANIVRSVVIMSTKNLLY